MALRPAPLWLLGLVVAVAPLESGFSSSSHSLKYFFASMWDPSEGLPHFVSQGYVDGQVFLSYDSNSRKVQPRVSWVEKAGKEDPQYWDRQTHNDRGNEEVFRVDLETLRSRYNQSEVPEFYLGFIVGCVVAVLVLLAGIAGILAFLKKRQDGYKAASRSNRAIYQPPCRRLILLLHLTIS